MNKTLFFASILALSVASWSLFDHLATPEPENLTDLDMIEVGKPEPCPPPLVELLVPAGIDPDLMSQIVVSVTAKAGCAPTIDDLAVLGTLDEGPVIWLTAGVSATVDVDAPAALEIAEPENLTDMDALPFIETDRVTTSTAALVVLRNSGLARSSATCEQIQDANPHLTIDCQPHSPPLPPAAPTPETY